MHLRPTNSGENQAGGRAILPAAGFLAGSGRLERRLRPRLAALQYQKLTVGLDRGEEAAPKAVSRRFDLMLPNPAKPPVGATGPAAAVW